MKIAALSLIAFFLVIGCQTAKEITDVEFREILSHPRQGERFHYIGSEGEFDFFVGEQWRMHSYPAKAKQTELMYKIKKSSYVNERFSLTKDVRQWADIPIEK